LWALIVLARPGLGAAYSIRLALVTLMVFVSLIVGILEIVRSAFAPNLWQTIVNLRLTGEVFATIAFCGAMRALAEHYGANTAAKSFRLSRSLLLAFLAVPLVVGQAILVASGRPGVVYEVGPNPWPLALLIVVAIAVPALHFGLSARRLQRAMVRGSDPALMRAV
jgi:hypothetical protein